MSWDASIRVHTGISWHEVEDIDSYTFNVSEMYCKAGYCIGNASGERCDIILPILHDLYKELKSNPEEYKKYNPLNGWGNYEGALKFLSHIIEACERHPSAYLFMY